MAPPQERTPPGKAEYCGAIPEQSGVQLHRREPLGGGVRGKDNVVPEVGSQRRDGAERVWDVLTPGLQVPDHIQDLDRTQLDHGRFQRAGGDGRRKGGVHGELL